LKSYALLNVETSVEADRVIQYDEATPYYQHWTDGLEHLQENYFIYLQEDMPLFGDADAERIQACLKFLQQSTEHSFVRLIRAGKDTSTEVSMGEDLYPLKSGSPSIFAMQPTIWRKEDFLQLYASARPKHWADEQVLNEEASKLKMKGVFLYQGEPKRGKNHYDSSAFPYVATALNTGKWNFVEYRQELSKLLTEYQVDPSVRGTR
jgi:hypothetical protein